MPAGLMGAQLALHIAAHGYPVASVDQSTDALGRMRRGHEEELDSRIAAQAHSANKRTAVLEHVQASPRAYGGVRKNSGHRGRAPTGIDPFI